MFAIYKFQKMEVIPTRQILLYGAVFTVFSQVKLSQICNILSIIFGCYFS